MFLPGRQTLTTVTPGLLPQPEINAATASITIMYGPLYFMLRSLMKRELRE
jgi:hypothetical protein